MRKIGSLTVTLGAGALALLIGVLGGASAQAQTLDEILTAGKIRIGVSAASVPMGYLDDKQQLVGYEPELAKMLADELGVEAEIMPVPANVRLQFLLAGKADLMMALLSITPERAKQVLYSDPYATVSTVVIGPKSGDIKTFADLKGKRIGVGRGNVADLYLTDKLGDSATIMRFDDTATTFQAIRSSQVDAMVGSNTSTDAFMGSNPDLNLERKLVLLRYYDGVVMRKGAYELQNFVNAFLVYYKGNGQLASLWEKWFNEPLPDF